MIMPLRLFFIIYFSFIQLVHAGQELTFEDCVIEASRANPSLKAAQSVLQSASHQLQQAYSSLYPQLSSSLTFNYANQASSSTNVASGGTLAASLIAKYNIFAGQRDVSRIDQAIANLDAAQADVQAAKSQLSFDLKTAFANAVRARDLLQVIQDIKAQREASHKLVSLLFDSGRENLGSVLIAKANLDEAAASLEQTKEAVRAASIGLARVLGRDLVEDVKPLGDNSVGLKQAQPDFTDLAMRTPTYTKALAQERSAIAAKNVIRSDFFPSVDLTSSLGDTTTANGSTQSWIFGLTFSHSLFNGGNSYYGLKSATQAVTTSAMTKRASLLDTAANIASTFFAFNDSIRQLDVDKSFVKALQVQEKISTERYNTGLLTFQNWDLIVSRLFQKLQQVVVAKQNAVSAQAAFEKAMGTGVIP